MDRRQILAGGLAAATMPLIGARAFAQATPKAKPPVMVTSFGQSLDAFQVQLVVKRAGIPYAYDAHVTAEELGEAKTLFIAVGASLKGFGDAGITINDELARASRILDAAKNKGIFIVALHMGGVDRRDALSNQLIELTAPRANLLIIRNDSDGDGLFTKIAKAGNIPVMVVESVVDLKKPVTEMFSGA